MLESLNSRIAILKAAVNRPIPRWLLIVWGVITLWDTMVAQLMPPEWAPKMPNTYMVLVMTGGLLLWWQWVLIGLVLLVLITLEYALYHKRRAESAGVQIGKPTLIQNPPPSMSERRRRLSALRSEGVEIRNRGQHRSRDDLPGWIAETERWLQNVLTAISAIDEADAEWFRTLDAVPTARVVVIPTADAERRHIKAFNEHDYRLVRLDQLIQRYGGRA
jgi:hypothetical protein